MRIGIIGGGFGVSGHLSAFSGLPDVEVVAVADSGSGRVLEHLPDVSTYRCSWHDLLDSSIDAVSIVTPPATHHEMVMALVAGGKQLLCEKPFGINPVQSRQMTDAAASARVTTAVSFQYRYEPGLQAMKKLLDEKRIGHLHSIQFSWLTSGRRDPRLPWTWRNDAEQGGGVISAFLSHVVDLIHWLTGDRVNEVQAKTKIMVPYRPLSDDSMFKVTAEDWVTARLVLSGGARVFCYVSNSHSHALGMRIEFLGSRGRLIYTHSPPFTPEAQQLHLHDADSKPKLILTADNLLGPFVKDTRLPALRKLLHSFVRKVSHDVISDLPTFEDGLDVQNVLHAVRHSATSGSIVFC